MGLIPTRGVLKACSGTGSTDGTGDVTIDIKVPGTFAGPTVPGRYLDSGDAAFDNPAVGDCITKIQVVDIDNKLGAGAGYIASSYIDLDVSVGNQSLEILKSVGWVSVKAFGDPGKPPSELYLRISAKAASNRSDTFRVNIYWAEPE